MDNSKFCKKEKPIGASFALLNNVAGMLVKQLKDEQDVFLELDAQQEINAAKAKGLDVTRKMVNTWNKDPLFKWKLLPISKKTANKLLKGEFETFKELKKEVLSQNRAFVDIQILYKEVYDKNRRDYICVIETIFINE